MGIGDSSQGRLSYALISMTNKDVYYVSTQTANDIFLKIKSGEIDTEKFVETIDIKSNNRVAIAIDKISSVVVKGGKNG